jgi:hypothetical protein
LAGTRTLHAQAFASARPRPGICRGHGYLSFSPNSTQQYAKITPATLTKAYQDAACFERNVRTIEVLIDRDAVQNGTAAAGEPWQYYDLGHG